ncbi:MAG: hypothetical protein ABWZ82_03300 [Candidatus Limnocylindrales bacterium]
MTPTDPFEERLPSALADLAQPLSSDYLPDLVVRTRRVRQRPAWTFPERWIPMTATTRRATTPMSGLRVALGLSVALLLTLIITIGVLLATGSAPPAVVSPQNGLIAYELDGDIWVADPDTTEPRVLVDGPAREYDPWWSRDGSRLVYAIATDGGDLLRTIRPDGTDEITLTPEPLAISWYDWSPDGRELAIAWDADGDGTTSLGLLAADGRGPTTLETGMESMYPMWSPDGSTILFRGVVEGVPGLYTVPATGGPVSAPLVVTDATTDMFREYGGENDIQEPTWSPDGTRIAYHALEVVPGAGIDGNGYRVHVMDADGTNDHVIEASPESDDEWGALWAPDGRSLAFQTLDADPDAQDEMGRYALEVAVATTDGDAATIRRLGPVTYRRVPYSPNRTSFGWAPDSSTIVAADPKVATMTLDLGTGAPTMLPWHSDGVPAWQPLVGS